MSEKTIRVAVVGVGHFGKIHAAKYAASPNAQLVAVADADPERGGEIARLYGITSVTDHRDLIGKVDAVSIAVPTTLHYAVARFFLENGVHVLIEKPITSEVAQADELIALAHGNRLVLQVGHLVRFFAKDTGLLDAVRNPLYIEAARITPFSPRVTDVSVVLDLMIHDIDLIAVLVKSPVARIQAVGAPVLSDHVDIVNARLEFENGCVANVTASRVAFKSERKMRIFQPDRMFNVDTVAGSVQMIRKPDGRIDILGPDLATSGLDMTETVLSGHDALMAEVEAFLDAIRTGREPVVSGEDGRVALDIAQGVLDAVAQQAEKAHHGQQERAGA